MNSQGGERRWGQLCQFLVKKKTTLFNIEEVPQGSPSKTVLNAVVPVLFWKHFRIKGHQPLRCGRALIQEHDKTLLGIPPDTSHLDCSRSVYVQAEQLGMLIGFTGVETV